ncbi:MAG TPA: SGNH/GDSL hydrolase family protein [Candidatus Dormibacteraeota bacterium]|nr:SGNH/GDSL hydrolase family protein [Candidatus Dormibacteraeota bacterium]
MLNKLLCLAFFGTFSAYSQAPELAQFHPAKAPPAEKLLLKQGDRLAICGDSITEQKMYSRIVEDYLTMCVPELNITVRQYGWSGEKASGFLARLTNDCLRFNPTVATTCYGMNDHEYKPYEERIGQTYREKSTAIIEAFKANGVRVIQGSAGCVGKMPGWVKGANGSVNDLNLNLCELRNIGIELARTEKVGFADVFWPMLTAGVTAHEKYGTNFAISGGDGVHPNWAGHTVMAYAFLKAFGLSGDIGTFTVDLKNRKMKATDGHRVVSSGADGFELTSTRYPFCACIGATNCAASYPPCAGGDETRDNTIRSAMTLIPFNQELNRLVLVAKNGKSKNYRVSWGPAAAAPSETRTFSASQLERGINLAEEFPQNPFAAAFAKVDAAVAAKEAYETRQIKNIFHGAEGKADMETAAQKTEAERGPLALAMHEALVPVTHRIRIEPL